MKKKNNRPDTTSYEINLMMNWMPCNKTRINEATKFQEAFPCICVFASPARCEHVCVCVSLCVYTVQERNRAFV